MSMFAIGYLTYRHVFLMALQVSMISDCIALAMAFVVSLVRGKNPEYIRNLEMPLTVAITVVLVVGGWFNIRTVTQTEYAVTTDKVTGTHTIVFVSDVHYGTTQPIEIVQKAVNEINALEPDVVVLGGDIVDEMTSHEKMEEVFEAFGDLSATRGVYFIYGNHDRQLPEGAKLERTFTDGELIDAITGNGIEILRDEMVDIGDNIVLTGREDLSCAPAESVGDASSADGASDADGAVGVGDAVGATGVDSPAAATRQSSAVVYADIDTSAYNVVLEHQPTAAYETAEYGADLYLCGHTHAGQFIPNRMYYTYMYHISDLRARRDWEYDRDNVSRIRRLGLSVPQRGEKRVYGCTSNRKIAIGPHPKPPVMARHLCAIVDVHHRGALLGRDFGGLHVRLF